MIPFDLVLFDFDGLLVDTEALHFKAYVKLCQNHGCHLDWDITRFFSAAHFDSKGVEKALYQKFPELYKEEPRWPVLYEEKKQIYKQLLEEGGLRLMPGAEPLLKALADAEIRRCVVTNSSRAQVNRIKDFLPVLLTIPLWITREDYVQPKPIPSAIKRPFLCSLSRAIGSLVLKIQCAVSQPFKKPESKACSFVLPIIRS